MEKETHVKESLAKHDLADCIGTMQTLCVVKKTQHGIYLAKPCRKDSLDSTPLRQTAEIKAQNNKRLDSITNCHVERSETSNIESKKDFLLNTQNDKDTESKQNLDSNNFAPLHPAPTQVVEILESAPANHANKTTNSSDCSMALEALSELEDRSYLSDNDYPSNSLNRSNCIDKGEFLQNLDLNKIVLLPNAYTNGNEEIGDYIEVFIHTDSSDRILAATKKPLAMLNEIARLEIRDSNKDGLFLDIGLAKDIFMPTKSIHQYANHTHIVVRITQDKMKRLIAKKDINPLLKPCKTQNLLHKNVKIWTISSSPIGILCVVLPHYYHGMIYSNTLSYPLNLYEEYEAKVVKVRNDGKLDLIIARDINAVYNLIAKLNSKNEYFIVNDMSAKMLSMSKKGVKKELTMLLKQKRIVFIQHKGYCVTESHLAKEFLDNINSKKLDSIISSINVRGRNER
ncbi:S1-like domain-containing RNA-binding protein [Helicobacter bilis]